MKKVVLKMIFTVLELIGIVAFLVFAIIFLVER